MPLRVLLINPSSENRILLPMDGKKVRHQGHKPPLGLLYLGSHLKARTGHEVVLLDAQALGLTSEETVRRAAELRPDLIGVSSWTEFWYDIRRLGRGLKEALPGVHICLGGPHLGIYPRESLAHDFVDSIVVGDGEKPLARLADALDAGAEAEHPGLYLSGRDYPSFEPYVEADLDGLALPDRRLLPYRDYRSVLAPGLVTTMVTSRGCPFRCSFCKLRFQKTVLRSAANVVEEMRAIAALGIEEIEVYDDTFGIDRDRVLEICRLMREAGLRFRLSLRDRVSNIDEATLAALKEVGLVRLSLGVESGSDATLKRVGKGITVAQVRNAVRLAKRFDVEVLAYFMIGLPGETEADFRNTLELAKELEPDYANFSVTIPYPGTRLYREALESGVLARDVWAEYVADPDPDMVMPLHTEACDRDRLLAIHRDMVRSFYFRWSYVASRLRRIRSVGQFVNTARMALALLWG